MHGEYLSKEITKVCENCGIEKPLKMFYGGKKKDKVYYKRNCTRCSQRLAKLRKHHRETLQKPSPYFFCEESWRDFKTCCKCKLSKPIEEFHKRKDKTISHCKDCASEYKRKLFSALTPEKKAMYSEKRSKKWRSLSLEQRQQIVKNKSPETKERSQLRNKERYRESSEYRKERAIKDKAYRQKKYAAMSVAEREIELENRRKRRMVREARKRNCSIIVAFTKEDIIKRDGLNCYLCNKFLTVKKTTIDHVLPISRGGNHKPENAKIACMFCNCSKNNKTLTEYKKYRGDYARFQLFINFNSGNQASNQL